MEHYQELQNVVKQNMYRKKYTDVSDLTTAVYT